MTIRNDATRLRLVTDEKRPLRSVAARQGLVLLDTDLDEQSREMLDRIETETVDILGSPGRLAYPAGSAAFQCSGPGGLANLEIGAGHAYLAGWLVDNPTQCTLETQPHPRTGDVLVAPLAIVMKALIRHIDPVEKPALADVALGDAQASGRLLVDWQILPLSLPNAGPVTCASVPATAQWVALSEASSGTLAFIRSDAPPPTDPCSLLPKGGYTRLENLLYRVEVHGGIADASFPAVDGPRFGLGGLVLKYSRRNASLMVGIESIAGTELTVTPPALDTRNWFAPGLYAEIVSVHDDVDPRSALAHERLFRVAAATDSRVTLEGSAADIAATGCTGTPGGGGEWSLRLWEGVETVKLAAGGNVSEQIDLGDGIKLELGKGAASTIFRRGDYWTCAMRADGSVDWPVTGGVADKVAPHGPETRYVPLAAADQGAANFEDCRIPFASLTDRYLLYRGGDGQSVFAPSAGGMTPLAAKLRLAVMRGDTPVPAATIRWSFVAPAGSSCLIDGTPCDAGNPVDKVTNSDGLAEVEWSIDAAHRLDMHQVQAALLDGGLGTEPPILFTASFDQAAHTGYTPGQCALLNAVDNVQDALDTLCSNIGQKEPPTLLLRSILMRDSQPGGVETKLISDDGLILNALDVVHTAFTGGIIFLMEPGKLAIKVRPYDPVVEVELDLPYPMTDCDRRYWMLASQLNGVDNNWWLRASFGFQRVRLSGNIKVMENGLIWEPTAEALSFLVSAPGHLWGQSIFAHDPIGQELLHGNWKQMPPRELVCRIRLRSAMIWAEGDGNKERVYLNAEHLGVSGPTTGRELLLKERDPQVAGDLEMYVYLNVKLP